MRYPAGKQRLLDAFSRDLDDLEKTGKLGGSYERCEPYIVRVFQGLREFELIIYHIESKAWFDRNMVDMEAYTIAIRDFVKGGDCVFDLGCNSGFFSVLFGLLAGPRGRVEAFDPFPFNTLATRYNARLNYLQNVSVHTVGIGAARGSIKVHPHDSRSYIASAQEGAIELRIEPLSAFAHLRPDVLKIDIEGAEADLFGPEGLDALRTADRFVMELHPVHLGHRGIDGLSVLRSFSEAGYAVRHLDPLAPVFDPASYQEDRPLYFGIDESRRASIPARP